MPTSLNHVKFKAVESIKYTLYKPLIETFFLFVFLFNEYKNIRFLFCYSLTLECILEYNQL